MPEPLYEFIALVTKESPSEGEISKYMLSLRYHHRADLPHLLSFSVLLLSCNHLNYHKQLNPATLQIIYKQLLLQADFFFLINTYAKLLPLLAWAEGRPAREIEEVLGPPFREMTRAIPVSKLERAVSSEQARRCLGGHLALLRLLDSKNLFSFFFNLINGVNESLENDIDCYFMQLADSDLTGGLISHSELAIIQKNIELEYGKLRKRKYQEQTIDTVYRWLEAELQIMLQQGDNPSNHLLMELFSQVVRTQSNICGATLLQVLDASVQTVQPEKTRLFLELVDSCVIEGSYKIATQAILFLVCTIFTKIHSKKLKVRGEVVMEHFLLWKEVATRRQLPLKLLICLIEWLPFLYDKAMPTQTDPEILQLYRREIIKLGEGGQASEISGLRVLVEELEYRKMEGLYAQLEEFHSQMEDPQLKQPTHSSLSGRADFPFKASGLSKSNSEINSMLNSLESASLNRGKSKNELMIISKPNSQNGSYGSFGSFGSLNSDQSFRECVEIIMSLIDLFDYHVKEPSVVTGQNTTTKRQSFTSQHSLTNSNLLPVVSTHHQLSQSLSEERQERARRGDRGDALRDVGINTAAYGQDFKKRMVKRRGLVMKKQSIEVGYILDDKYCHYSLFVTFLKPLASCRLGIRENSFKIKRQKEWLFTEPKINKQYQISCSVNTIKLYSLEGVNNSERTVRSRLELRLTEGRRVEQEQVYDIPLTIFNLIQWQPVLPQDLPIFEQTPSLETKWHSICPKFIKHGAEYLRKFLPFSHDPKGNYLLKCQLLGQQVFARVLVVLGQAKVQIAGGEVTESGTGTPLGLLVAMGLLQVMG